MHKKDSIKEFVEKLSGGLVDDDDIAKIIISYWDLWSSSPDEKQYQITANSHYLRRGVKEVKGHYTLNIYGLYPDSKTIDTFKKSLIEKIEAEELYDHGESKDGTTIYIIKQDEKIYNFDAGIAILGRDFDPEYAIDMYIGLLNMKEMSEAIGILIKAKDYFSITEESSEGKFILSEMTRLKKTKPYYRGKLDNLANKFDPESHEIIQSREANEVCQLSLFNRI